MPFRPDPPSGLNLTRRTAAPVKLPKMTFPMLGAATEPAHQGSEEGVEGTVPLPEEMPGMEAQVPAAAVGTPQPSIPSVPLPPSVPARSGSKVIIYGRSDSKACLEAVQDLIARQVCFTYHDVDRDPQAKQHLMAICGGTAPVPVVIHIGTGST